MSYCCNTFLKAVKKKHFGCLVHLNIFALDCYSNNLFLCSIASLNNDSESLIYLTSRFELDLTEDVCKYAVIGNSIECLTIAHDAGYAMEDELLVTICAVKGYYDCLIYLINNDCKCRYDICNYAIACDSLSCLIFLLNKGYNYSEVTIAIAYFLHGERSYCYRYLKCGNNFDIENYQHLISYVKDINFKEFDDTITNFKSLLFYEEICGR